MKDKDLNLTPSEQYVLKRSEDLNITHKRIQTIYISGILYAILLTIAAVLTKSWILLLVVSLAYIAITIWEKVAYGRAVIVYKSIINKLKKKIEQKEERPPNTHKAP